MKRPWILETVQELLNSFRRDSGLEDEYPPLNGTDYIDRGGGTEDGETITLITDKDVTFTMPLNDFLVGMARQLGIRTWKDVEDEKTDDR